MITSHLPVYSSYPASRFNDFSRSSSVASIERFKRFSIFWSSIYTYPPDPALLNTLCTTGDFFLWIFSFLVSFSCVIFLNHFLVSFYFLCFSSLSPFSYSSSNVLIRRNPVSPSFSIRFQICSANSARAVS